MKINRDKVHEIMLAMISGPMVVRYENETLGGLPVDAVNLYRWMHEAADDADEDMAGDDQ